MQKGRAIFKQGLVLVDAVKEKIKELSRKARERVTAPGEGNGRESGNSFYQRQKDRVKAMIPARHKGRQRAILAAYVLFLTVVMATFIAGRDQGAQLFMIEEIGPGQGEQGPGDSPEGLPADPSRDITGESPGEPPGGDPGPRDDLPLEGSPPLGTVPGRDSDRQSYPASPGTGSPTGQAENEAQEDTGHGTPTVPAPGPAPSPAPGTAPAPALDRETASGERGAPGTEGQETLETIRLSWPLQGEIIARFHQVYRRENQYRLHQGLDLAAGAGEPVKAALEGKVLGVSMDPVLGNQVVLGHQQGEGLKTVYANLGDILVNLGQEIKAGEIIARVGESALLDASRGTFLHFGVREGERYRDPLEYLPPTGDLPGPPGR